VLRPRCSGMNPPLTPHSFQSALARSTGSLAPSFSFILRTRSPRHPHRRVPRHREASSVSFGGFQPRVRRRTRLALETSGLGSASLGRKTTAQRLTISPRLHPSRWTRHTRRELKTSSARSPVPIPVATVRPLRFAFSASATTTIGRIVARHVLACPYSCGITPNAPSVRLP